MTCTKPATWWGTTSAYAENTSENHNAVVEHENYLRVRGEY